MEPKKLLSCFLDTLTKYPNGSVALFRAFTIYFAILSGFIFLKSESSVISIDLSALKPFSIHPLYVA